MIDAKQTNDVEQSPAANTTLPDRKRQLKWGHVFGLIMLAIVIGLFEWQAHGPYISGTPLPRTGWKLSAGTNGTTAELHAAIDGDRSTRWTTTNQTQNNKQWFAVDMGKPQTFHEVVLDAGTFVTDFPRGYAVYASNDGSHWGSALSTGNGKGPVTVVELAPQKARFIKIVQTGRDAQCWWSICEFNVY